jgi:hypothetical protein
MAIMARVAACAGWTLKKPAMAVVSNRNVCRLFMSGQYFKRMDFTDGITNTRRAILFVNLTTPICCTRSHTFGDADSGRSK